MTCTPVRPNNTTHAATHPSAGKYLAAPLLGTGILMAGYLLARPYGDAAGGDTPAAAEAFASTWWVISHLCGMLAIATFARLAARVHDLLSTVGTRVARTLGLAGMALVLPYYGLETFGLQAAGRAALAGDLSALELVTEMRDHPVAMTLFGVGLGLLAVTGILLAIGWQRHRGDWAAWPLAVMMTLLLPQFFLPPTGRMAYGVLYAVAVGVWLIGAVRGGRDGS
ncbi:MAG: hypothetical protein GXX86_03480 [Propionibacterium sp.]|nr:hypothetical protein [Propionibacterium sp.]